MDFVLFLWKFAVIVISSIPLYFALHIVKSGKKPGLMKVMLVNVLAGAVVSAIDSAFGLFAGIFSFIGLLFVYKVMFDLGWLSSFLVWLIQGIIIAVAFAFLILGLGVALVL